jgi:hypothetical protein
MAMTSNKFKFAALIAVAVGTIWLGGSAVSDQKPMKPTPPDLDRLTDTNFPTIYEALQPPKVEPWKSIPWHISIVEAARQAEKEGKPIFMWQADGWPLGCG